MKGSTVIKPNRLKKGDTIGLVAPASPHATEGINKSLKKLEQFGYKIKIGKSLYQQYGYLSGNDVIRAQDINDMFADTEIQAIFCYRGGYGTPRIIDRIDYELIRQNPKIIAGYSDITALINAIYKKTGLVTFHAPLVAELSERKDPFSWDLFIRHLEHPFPVGQYYEPSNMIQFTIQEGIAEGKLIGGNLSLLTAMVGTPYEVDTKDSILFIEDVGEEPYRIDRMLTQLRLCGALERANGIIIADFARCEPKKRDHSLTIEQVLSDVINPLGVPCYYGLKAGHCVPNLTLPIGVTARMNASEGWVEILESGVK